ncbi:MAG: ABC transporter permease [Bacteroidales bacterium]|nr:ABC transporter permease [Bacteroidales bacterium]
MWLKFKASSVKEMLLLFRDRAGLAMLFVMPMALILIMTLLQDSTFKILEEKQMSVLVLNYDADTFGINIVEGLKQSSVFDVVERLDGKAFDENAMKQQLMLGNYRIGIVIRKNATTALKNKIRLGIQAQFPVEEGPIFDLDSTDASDTANVKLYFDPITQSVFRQNIISALHEFSAAVEAKILFGIYADLFNDMLDIQLKPTQKLKNLVVFEQEYASTAINKIVPNAVQHNVPAWTIFAMFFIVIPLAGNLIKERQSGVAMRLKTMPGSEQAVVFGKGVVYFVVGILQAIFMLLIGFYVLPLFGMYSLKIDSHTLPALALIIIATSMAATGYGIVIGTIATSQEQSSIFGSISVVILAALGGVWVPTFMMSEFMVTVSKLSPLNWGLNGFYDIFLRNANITEVLPYAASLTIFFLLCLLISRFYTKFK